MYTKDASIYMTIRILIFMYIKVHLRVDEMLGSICLAGNLAGSSGL